MEEGLKKRLVGAAVLAVLAVVFVPMLIEEPVEKAEVMRVPPAPKARPFESQLLREEVPVPVVPPARRSLPDTGVQSGGHDADQSRENQSKRRLRTGLTAWVVQVGSFSNKENAQKLVEKLRKAGFQTRDAEQVEIRGKVLYRVRVGPMLEKDRAMALLPKINKVSGTRGTVRAYP